MTFLRHSQNLKIFFFLVNFQSWPIRYVNYRNGGFFCRFVKFSKSQKLGLRQKWIILLSRIAILLLKGLFKRGKINLLEEILNLKLINFIFTRTVFSYCFELNF